MKCRKCGAFARGEVKVCSTRNSRNRLCKTRIMYCTKCGCNSYSLEIPIPANKVICNRHFTAKERFVQQLIDFAYSL